MRHEPRTLLTLLLLFSAALASAQIQYKAPPPFQHVVIIFQENRTPDNLFGAGAAGVTPTCGSPDPFEAGVDIDNGGPNLASKLNGGPYITCDTPGDLIHQGGDHSHVPGWNYEYDEGAMDGACLETWPNCPQYSYVQRSLDEPYFDIAINYGFANYMFETNQGPSFPAHQFIFGGTSAPVWPGDSKNYYQDFVAEIPGQKNGSGCPATGSGWPNWVNPGNQEITDPNSSECYDRNTLVTYQDSTGKVWDWTTQGNWQKLPYSGWKYYTPTKGTIWDAPEADPQTCYTLNGPPQSAGPGGNPPCSGTEFSHVVVAQPNQPYQSAPIFNDIANCNLAAISWVIPDDRWSDHPGNNATGQGPDYVAAIVNAIGNSRNNACGVDYWGYPATATSEPTAIFITWDDWGGFFDHILPPFDYFGDYNQQKGWWECTSASGNPNGWGCGYVYGFRVPLLVVSEWTPPGWVSGALPSPGATYFQHDFGSILRFTELNFSNQGLTLPYIAPQTPVKYTYADENTLDAAYINGEAVVPLWDFFLGPQRSFTPINPINPQDTAGYFNNFYYQYGQTPIGPETGDPDD